MTKHRNITINQGSNWEMTTVVTDATGTPIDLTDYTVAMHMKKSYNAKGYIAFNTEITDPILGKIRVWLDATESQAIKPIRYVYDFVIAGPTATIRYMEGIATINPSVSFIPQLV